LKVSDEEQEQPEREGRPTLRLVTRRAERRLPRLGLVRFRAPSASVEVELAPLYDGQARVFANALIAATIEGPRVSAADVDGWSERTRAIARVAAAEVVGCLADYRRLSGSGQTGDERLLAAMRARDARIRAQLAATTAALRDNVLRVVDTRALLRPPIEAMLRQQRAFERQQRAFERLVRPPVLEQMLRWNRQLDMLRASHFSQLNKLARQMALPRSAFAGVGTKQFTSLRDAFTGTDRLRAQIASFGPLFAGQFGQLGKEFSASRGLAANGAIASLLRGYSDTSSTLARHIATPTYFGALRVAQSITNDIGGFGRFAEQITRQMRPLYGGEFARLLDQLREPSWLDTIRRAVLAPLESYHAWIEREWAELKARKTPPPVLFLLLSLPAIIALQLQESIEADDELLLGSLEDELRNGGLTAAMQATIQRSDLDAVAKRHLVQGLTWVEKGQYVDAAPPLYQGLERAFKIVARERGVIDDTNRFIVAAHKSRARTVEDVFTYLGLDRFYIRFLNAWVFGEFGTSARHGDLGEDDHRRWVLRAVLGVAGWLEYLGGEDDFVAELVERLELAAGDEAADAG